MYSNQSFFSRNKIAVIATLITLIVLVAGYSAYLAYTRQGKLGVTVSIVPSSAQLTINNQPSGKGTLWLAPGVYEFTATLSGFEQRTKTVTVTDKKEQNVVAMSLAPTSDEAKDWAQKHAADYSRNEQYGGIEAREQGAYLRQTYPIITKLPYVDPYYKIAYTTDDRKLTLTIDTPSPRYRYFAVQKIRELGYNPTDYIIEFKQFQNPLAKTGEGS